MTTRPSQRPSARPAKPGTRPRPGEAAPRARTAEKVGPPPAEVEGLSEGRPNGEAVTSEPAGGPGRTKPPRVDRELFGRPSGRRASAGRVLAVGLICFGLWTLFDANQLYHNALSSPFGARRTVAVTLLRPLAAVTDAIGLSGPVNAADSALGRNGAATSATLPKPPPQPVTAGARPINNAGESGMAPRPHGGRVAPPPKTVWPPPVAQPTLAHPLVMLDIGDSIGEDLGYGLGDLFGNDRYVKVIQRGKIDTGLARPDIYNWPAVLDEELKHYHPGVVVIMLGANDDQSLSLSNGQAVSTSSPAWGRIYRQRISLLMAEATASGAHVLWVGLPPLSAPSVNTAFAERVNGMAKELAAARSGVTYVPSWSVLAGPHGTFTQYKRVNGSVQQIRYSDGVHLAPAGWDLLASSLLAPMERAWHVALHAHSLFKLG